ncbi:uncharacterized protein LY79DRAFT_536161 [Colletotrichum navitas]|uniref:Uncharacterized protein n=1 Tax=Colletotrichum navitas TaxID=681940 RepID=A0AAD8VC88_9PEZI|nr:uncharacterized protein LY79DRAFT_536161 [Colletotrichum navitas]KAK1599811.1 hypothetical protein LY79DRAFT_536161 [Colletotrichum navitas]
MALRSTSMFRATKLGHLVFLAQLRSIVLTLFVGTLCKLPEVVDIFVAERICRAAYSASVVPTYFLSMACPWAGSLQRRGPFRRRGDVGLFLQTCWTRRETGGPFSPNA